MIGNYIKPKMTMLVFAFSFSSTSLVLAEGGLMDSVGGGLDAAKGAAQVAQPSAGSVAAGAVGGESSSLVGSLTSKLGVSTQQAEGGAGSLFQMAKSKLDADSFQSIADVVPGMDGLLGAAPKPDATSRMAGGVAALGGDSASSAVGAASVAGQFQQLGLSPDMAGKFVPVVVDYVKSQGGETVANLLGSALGGF